MGFFNDFPYTNFHELNIDWLLREFDKLKKYVENYTAVNNVSYGGIWDITKQYPKWSVVSTENSSYISIKAVPAGIDIENSNYWTLLADLDPRIGGIMGKLVEIDGELDGINGELDEINKEILKVGASVKPTNMEALGCDSGGNNDCTEIVNKAISDGHKHLYFPAGKYKIGTVNLVNGVTISGDGVNTIFIAADSNKDIFTHTSFEQFKDVGVTESTEGVCKNVTLYNFMVSGGKRNIAIYGFHIHIFDVFASGASEYNIYLCSPGGIHSNAEQSLQNMLTNVVCAYGIEGNIFYNGQSDSLFCNILCYYSDASASEFDDAVNIHFSTKSSGCKMVNAHFWGHCKEQIRLDAGNCTFDNIHAEGALTQIFINRPLNIISNIMVYDPLHTNESTAISLGQYCSGLRINGNVRQCKTVIKTNGYNPGDVDFELTVRDVPDDVTILSSALTGGVYSIKARTSGGISKYEVFNPAFKCSDDKLYIGNYTYSPGTPTFNAYLTVYDKNGAERKIPVISE